MPDLCSSAPLSELDGRVAAAPAAQPPPLQLHISLTGNPSELRVSWKTRSGRRDLQTGNPWPLSLPSCALACASPSEPLFLRPACRAPPSHSLLQLPVDRHPGPGRGAAAAPTRPSAAALAPWQAAQLQLGRHVRCARPALRLWTHLPSHGGADRPGAAAALLLPGGRRAGGAFQKGQAG